MRFGFYVSNRATRLTRALRCLRSVPELRGLLSDFAFVFRDGAGDDELPALCRRSGIETLQAGPTPPTDGDRSAAVSRELLSAMERHRADYLFVFGSRLLKGELLDRFRNRIVNFHPSLLPAFPGLKSVDQAASYGSIVTGNTAHFIDEGTDTGPIIMQSLVTLQGETDYDAVLDRQIPMLIQIILWLKENRIRVDGRRVTVERAAYRLGPFVPNLEIADPPGAVLP